MLLAPNLVLLELSHIHLLLVDEAGDFAIEDSAFFSDSAKLITHLRLLAVQQGFII